MIEDVKMLEDVQVFDIFEDAVNDSNNAQADATAAYIQGIKDRISSFEDFVDVQVDNDAFLKEMEADQASKIISEDDMFRDRMERRKKDLAREKDAVLQNAAAFKQFSDNSYCSSNSC